MSKHNVAILYGGRSGEHNISLMSASSVEKHLNKSQYNIHLIGITLDGIWYYQKNYKNETDTLNIVEDQKMIISIVPGKGFCLDGKQLELDFIFPILHGTYGEDGTMQGLLDMVGIPYAGAGIDGSVAAMDKEYAKVIWEKAGLPVVPFIGIKKFSYTDSPDRVKSEAEDKFAYPMFVKPVKAGSSVGVSMVNTPEEFHDAMIKAFDYDLKVLIEPAVDAREVECSVIGNNNPEVFTPGEIAPSHEFYDYDAKYIDPDGAALIIPAKIDENQANEIKKMAVDAYLALNIKGFSRVDFFLDRKTGKIMLNEINTIPGFTKVSMFSMLCAQDGLSYSDLLDKLYCYGVESFKELQSLNFDKDIK